jgi:hypothetical protein
VQQAIRAGSDMPLFRAFLEKRVKGREVLWTREDVFSSTTTIHDMVPGVGELYAHRTAHEARWYQVKLDASNGDPFIGIGALK